MKLTLRQLGFVALLVPSFGTFGSTAKAQAGNGQVFSAACLALEAANIAAAGRTVYGREEPELNSSYERATAKLNAIFDGHSRSGSATCSTQGLSATDSERLKAALPAIQRAMADKLHTMVSKLVDAKTKADNLAWSASQAETNSRAAAQIKRLAEDVVNKCGDECRKSPEVAGRIATVQANEDGWKSQAAAKMDEAKVAGEEVKGVQISIDDLNKAMADMAAIAKSLK